MPPDFSWEGFCPSRKIYRRDFVHLVKMSGGILSTLQKNKGGIMSTDTKNGRGDFVREGFCPTLFCASSEKNLKTARSNLEFQD